MAKPDPSSSKKEKMKNMKWVITIFLVTIVVSGTISMGSDALMSVSGIAVAFLILLKWALLLKKLNSLLINCNKVMSNFLTLQFKRI